METNARYLLIGSFTLAVIVTVFGFVFWLGNAGGLGDRQVYRVRFGTTASGLQPGAAVLFNGIRVGEVSGVKLDPGDFQHVLATISVAKGTPLRTNTKAGLQFQGLMGTAAVALEGGAAGAPAPSADGGAPPLLVADSDSARTLTQTAQTTLERVDRLIADNSDALGASITNLKVFSGALARNAGRVDAVMAGLEKMTGGGPAKPIPQLYDLGVPKLAAWSGPARGQILVADITAVIALQTQRLLTRSAEGQLAPLGEFQWSDTLPKLLQEKVMQTLEDGGIAATLTPATTPKAEDRLLQIDLRSFDVASTTPYAASIVFSAKIASGEGKILGMRVFRAETPSASGTGEAAVKALDASFAKTMNDLAVWMIGVS